MRNTLLSISEITNLVTDGKHGDCQNEEGSGYFFLSSKELRGGRLIYDNPRQIRKDDFLETHRRTNLLPGDVLLTNTGASIGRVGIAQQDERIKFTTFQKSISVIKVKPEIVNNRYLYYFFLANSKYLEELGNGTAQPNLLVGDIKRIRLSIPSMAVQEKIAAILSAYDDLIENNKRRIALLENMAEEIYRECFIRFRFPGYQTTEFEKGIPKGWEEGALGDISNMLMGQSPKSVFYNTSGDGLPFHQGVGSYGARFPVNEVFCSVDGRTAKKGDILFSVRAPVGRLNIANEKLIIGRGLAAISHRNDCNSYLFYLLKVAFANEDIIGNGAIFNSVGKDELKAFKIFLPPSSLVEEFENQASIIDKQILALLQSVKNLEKTKNMLLSRLISGKLSVEELDDVELALLEQLTFAIIDEVTETQQLMVAQLCEWHRRWLGNVIPGRV